MQIRINNANQLVGAETKLVGAAVKIVVAGGSRLPIAQQEVAAGLTGYTWDKDASAVRRLVKLIEAV